MHRKRFIQAALGVAMACVTLLALQPSASAATVGPVLIEGWQAVGECINDPGNSKTLNTQMIIYQCQPETLNAEWNFVEVDTTGATYYNIRNQFSGLCLTVQNASNFNNAAIIQYACNTGANEEWGTVKQFTHNNVDFYNIYSRKNPNKCITIQNEGTDDGAKLLQFDCNFGGNQDWTWYPTS